MGLDMYMYAQVRSTILDYGRDEEPPEDRQKMLAAAEAVGLKDSAGEGNYGPVSIEMQVGYWRKANAVHGWFVEHVQDGVDECQRSRVELEQIVELRELCEKVVATAKLEPGKVVVGQRGTASGWEDMLEDGEVCTNADEIIELLPPTSGLFFGSSDIDGFFIDNIKHTIKVMQLCEALAARHRYNVSFHYQSSW